jgi:hypothetical protein
MSAPLDLLTRLLGAEQARAVLETLNSAGLVVVPRTPTQAMLDAGWYSAHDEDAAGVWEEMIDAATS